MFTETLDVVLKGRYFTIEAPQVVKYDDDGVTILRTGFATRVWETVDGQQVLVNADSITFAEKSDDAIQDGFVFLKELVKR